MKYAVTTPRDILVLLKEYGYLTRLQLAKILDKEGTKSDAIPIVVVRRGTRPDIPDAVGKNLEGNSWIVVLTWSGNTKGTRACTKSVGTLKMCRRRECKIRTRRLKLIA
jgi:hypothetical protein